MTGTAPARGSRSARLRRLMLAIGLCALLLALTPALAPASEASEQREGQRLLRSIENGSRNCSDLSNDDFALVGEYVMGRMAGTTAAHEQMDELIQRMMGARSLERMHVFMGRRFSGCGGGPIPSEFGGMMGIMGGGVGSGTQGLGFGSMMGSFGANNDQNGDGWSGAAIAMTVLMGLLVALAAGALLIWRPWRAAPRGSALELLNARYARGELDGEEYERRRQALGGG